MSTLDQALMQLSVSLAPMARSYKAAADKLAADFGLSQASAWPVVMVSRLGDGVRPGKVAHALGIEPSSMVRVIDQLVEAGLVERRDDPEDRRARTLYLTAAGKRCAQQIEAALPPFRRAVFDGVARADLDACLRVFAHMEQYFSSHGDATDQ